MATIRWTGGAAKVAQVDTFTPANVEIGDIFTLTVTGLDGTTHAISFTATAATVANVTAGIETAWNASSNTLCTPITATDNTTTVSLAADTAGTGFSVASTETDGGGTDTQTFTRAATTANAGPEVWDSGDNWSGGSAPGGAVSQDVYLDDWSGDIFYGLDQSGISNALSSLNIDQSFTGKIGNDGAGGYDSEYLDIKTAVLDIGYHNGPGTPGGFGRLLIDTGSTACVVTVFNTGTATDTNKPTVRLLADSASTTITVNKGKVGVAYEAGETSTVSSVACGWVSNRSGDADVFIGSGVTVTTVSQTGGETTLGCGATTVTIDAGVLTTVGSGVITTINITGGTVYPNSSGTITTVNITDGTFDCTRSTKARTITTLKLDAPAVLKYDPSIVTLTNKVQPYTSTGVIIYTGS